MLVFRFYGEGESAHFEEKKYRKVSDAPPVPRLGEKIALADEMFVVVETPAHYFERVHEIALIVKPLALVDEDEVPTTVAGSVASPGAPVNAQGRCVYCDGPDCPGGEDCNFYDGTLG